VYRSSGAVPETVQAAQTPMFALVGGEHGKFEEELKPEIVE
jgi:hypothetical protein